jgi:hypothetical protein
MKMIGMSVRSGAGHAIDAEVRSGRIRWCPRYLRAWSEKYQQGLVVIGVHTPEFPFEHELENVRRAVRQLRIEYPVAIDNDYAVWRAFDNNYWPALYFLDPRGRIRHHHFGEGEYEHSERMIQRLLAEAGGGAAADQSPVRVSGTGVGRGPAAA